MSHWQLIKSLERDGWGMKGIGSKECLARARRTPYDVNDPRCAKVWYVRPNTTNITAVSKEYLRLLLTAPEHEVPVPHLAPQA
eukprot:50867-Lingulodinium_polyedra.AAC.1